MVQAESPAHARWAARQALNSHSCGVILLWLADADMGALRRLQLAAEESATTLILIRPASAASQPSPAVLRVALASCSGGLELRILKRRGPQLAGPLGIDLPWPGGAPRPGRATHPPRPTAASPQSSIHALVRPLPARPGPASLHAGAQ
jgi:protein ImuA